MHTDPDIELSSYQFDLPEDNIAQSPAERRDCSRLMVLDRSSGETSVGTFADLGAQLPGGALLVANNSRVLPARLLGHKPSGGKVEFLLLTPLPMITPDHTDGEHSRAEVQGLLRASKGPRKDDVVRFAPDLQLTVLEKGDFGLSRVELRWTGDLLAIFDRVGHLPLPPYIRRPDNADDATRYQTTYADPARAGSVAAPTAGLHFTPELRRSLRDQGFTWAEVTLYVGYGTFSPVRAEDIREHRMHSEHIEVSEETAEALLRAKAERRPVVAVGTTSARTLEGMYRELGKIGAYNGETDIFIRPGYRFQVVNHLLTNFHLPGSSLVIMVSALAGRERVLAAYREAVQRGLRFFSYGDAMLIR